MKQHRLDEMVKGWFVGRFAPTAYDAEAVEVGVKVYKAGDREAAHYHKVATELYYVVEGQGTMTLDGESVELRPGACVEVKPGVVHAARGDVLVLVVGMPSISDADTFFPSSSGVSP